MMYVILILISVIVLIFGGLAFYLASSETRQRKQLEKEIKENE